MYREAFLDPADLAGAAVAACETHEPLGTYASLERINYLFVDRCEVVRLSAQRSIPETHGAALASASPLFDWHERDSTPFAPTRRVC